MFDDIRKLWDHASWASNDRRDQPALLGALDGTSVTVPGRVGYHYARRGPNGELGEIIVKNTKTPAQYDLIVRIRLRGGEWLVVEAEGQYNDPDINPGESSIFPHASTHQHGGADEVGTATPGANAIIKADADGKIGAGWIDDADINLDNVTEGTTNKFFSAAEETKLAGIEAAADVTDAVNIASSIHGATGKTTPVDADTMPLIDSAASNVLKKVTWANIKATLKTYMDGLYDAVGSAATVAGNLASHIAATATHGATGAVVGTTNAQTLTNKTLTAPTIADFTNMAHDHQDADDGGQLDHGLALTGLGDDDHTQYHNDTRGDARYGRLASNNNWTADNTFNTPLIISVAGQDYAISTTSDNVLALQGLSSGQPGSFRIFSLDGDGTDYVGLQFFSVGTPSNITNRERINLEYIAGTGGQIHTNAAGTGTLRPLVIFVGTNTDQIKLGTDGKVGFSIATALARVHVVEPTLGNEVFRLESIATNDDVRESVYQGRVATTNNSATTILTIPIPASTTVGIEYRVVGRRTGGSSGTAEDGGFFGNDVAYKNVSGTATLLGVATAFSINPASWGGVGVSTSGGNFLLQVTGATNVNISWHVTARVYPISS